MFVNEDIVTFYTHTHTRVPGNTRCVKRKKERKDIVVL